MILLQNAVDETRKKVTIESFSGNIGGSRVINSAENLVQERGFREVVNSVLLSDIFGLISQLRKGKPTTTVIMKVDIETFECKAFLGSPKIFEDPEIFIPYVVMEWHFLSQSDGKVSYSENCGEEKIKTLTKLFRKHGYVPFKVVILTNISWKPLFDVFVFLGGGVSDCSLVGKTESKAEFGLGTDKCIMDSS